MKTLTILIAILLFPCSSPSAGILTLFSADFGEYTELYPSPGPPNWSNARQPADHNFCSDNTKHGITLTDTYTMDHPGPSLGTITNVRVFMVITHTLPAFGVNKAFVTLLVDGELFLGPENNNPATGSVYFDWPTSPHTGNAWEWHEISPGGHEIEAGVRLFALGDPTTDGAEIRVEQVKVEVTF